MPPQPSSERPLSPGVGLGQYRIVEHLGTGGMGTVYKATDTKLGRTVALKLVRPDMLEDAAGIARFEREARLLASLNHPHIAVIYDFEEHEGVRFLSLEYVSGPTLAERLRRGPLPYGKRSRLEARSPRRSRPRTPARSSTVT